MFYLNHLNLTFLESHTFAMALQHAPWFMGSSINIDQLCNNLVDAHLIHHCMRVCHLDSTWHLCRYPPQHNAHVGSVLVTDHTHNRYIHTGSLTLPAQITLLVILPTNVFRVLLVYHVFLVIKHVGPQQLTWVTHHIVPSSMRAFSLLLILFTLLHTGDHLYDYMSSSSNALHLWQHNTSFV